MNANSGLLMQEMVLLLYISLLWLLIVVGSVEGSDTRILSFLKNFKNLFQKQPSLPVLQGAYSQLNKIDKVYEQLAKVTQYLKSLWEKLANL